ncbi:hypothetical protein [Pseudomaricurvus albidus]|nr:hypothetical protein [Aestuariicella albida]
MGSKPINNIPEQQASCQIIHNHWRAFRPDPESQIRKSPLKGAFLLR